jgi:hypothetical protein
MSENFLATDLPEIWRIFFNALTSQFAIQIKIDEIEDEIEIFTFYDITQ